MFQSMVRLPGSATRLASSSARLSTVRSPLLQQRLSTASLRALQHRSTPQNSRVTVLGAAPQNLPNGVYQIPKRGFFQNLHWDITTKTTPGRMTEDEARGYTDPVRVRRGVRFAYFLLIANGLVFAMQLVERWLTGEKSEFMDRHFNLNEENLKAGRVWNLFTGLFRQVDMRAIPNLIILADAARVVALEYGALRLLLLYFMGCCAAYIGRELDHTFLRPRIDAKRTPERREELPYNYDGPVSLAAGGCGAVLAASLKKFGKTKMWPRQIIYPSKSFLFLALVLGLDVYDAMFRPLGGDRYSHSGYISGGLVGLLSWFALPAVTAPAFAAGGAVTKVVAAAPLVKLQSTQEDLPCLDFGEDM